MTERQQGWMYSATSSKKHYVLGGMSLCKQHTFPPDYFTYNFGLDTDWRLTHCQECERRLTRGTPILLADALGIETRKGNE